MTNDFKKKILDWLSGNYSVSSGNNIPTFSEPDSYFNDLQNRIDTLFPHGFYIDGSLQANDINGDGLKYTIVYGEYNPTASSTLEQRKGAILILDDDFDLVQAITQYSSGTQFNVFEIINVGDDGNFFAIERMSNNFRFVMMNNFIAKLPTESAYKVVLKKSYTLQGQAGTMEEGSFKSLIKAPGQSKYVIAGIIDTGNIGLTELRINVGTSNEWIDYSYTGSGADFDYGDLYANWSGDNFSFKIAGFKYYWDDDPITIKFAELTGSSSNVGTMTLTTYGSNFDFEYISDWSVKIISSTEAYFGITLANYGEQFSYNRIYHFKNNTINMIYEKKSLSTGAESSIKLYRIDNEIFYFTNYVAGTIPNERYYLAVGKIIGDNCYDTNVMDSDEAIEYMFFIVQKQFDLYNYYIQIGTNVEKTSQIYNPNEYNGAPYQALNSMIPDRAELISEQVVIFARSLYNRIINNNTTISIVNVPNNYINDVIIDAQNLYSETKNMLVNNNQNIETNIYEELMINFVNTLLMRNENDINNKIDNLAGAIRLNKSISSLLDYDNCKIAKYKINYEDGTNVIKDLVSGSNITYSSSKTEYLISFYNDETKPIKNIQLLSNDGSTNYQTIDLSSLATNKYYAIRQDLKVV